MYNYNKKAEGEIFMTIGYDIEKIKKIIDDLHSITGLSLGFMDNEHKYLYRKLKENDSYCDLINSTAEGRKRCLCSDNDMTAKCSETMKPFSHVCHAGVIDTTVPIIKSGIICGFIVIGRVRRDSTEDLPEKLFWLGEQKEEIISHYRDLSYFSEERLESLVDIVSNIIFENAVSIKQESVAEIAAEHIEKNLSENLTVENICAALYVSKNKLYRDFHERHGKTVNEYITEKRLDLAAKLLSDTEYSVSQIAELVGIGNPPYFSELFKKKNGVTPKKYRDKEKKRK